MRASTLRGMALASFLFVLFLISVWIVLMLPRPARAGQRNLSGIEVETTQLPEELRYFKRLMVPVSIGSGTTTTLLNAPASGNHIKVLGCFLQAQGAAVNWYFLNVQTTAADGTTATANLPAIELLGDGATAIWDGENKPFRIASATALQLHTSAGTLAGWVQAYFESDVITN